MLISLSIHAQFSSVNSFIRKELVSYTKNNKGFYVKDTNKMVDEVDGIVENYAYDKKAHNLYVLTENSNVVITLTKDYAKIIKKNKGIPQFSREELDVEIEKRNKQLSEKFLELNRKRQQEITDSINKVKQDSIDEINRRNAIIAAQNKARKDYRENHKCNAVPLVDCSMYCEICEKYINTKDVFYTLGIHNDTIYYATTKEGDLGLTYIDMHESKIPSAIESDKDFLYHYEAFKDSLDVDTLDYDYMVRFMGYNYFNNYWRQIKESAPFGYINDWGWDCEYSMVTLNLEYTNTNSKTIKYITVYFKITNDVGDLRKTGYFQGTGPVKEGGTASWDWDSSFYYTAGDSSKMNITKIVLTYMNGTKKVLTGNNIILN